MRLVSPALRRNALSALTTVPERLLDSLFEKGLPFLSEREITLARSYYGFGVTAASDMAPIRAQLNLTPSVMSQAFIKIRQLLKEVAEETYLAPADVLKQTCLQFFSHARAQRAEVDAAALKRIKRCVMYADPSNPRMSFFLGHSEHRARELFAFTDKTLAQVKAMLATENLHFRQTQPGAP